MRKLKWVLTGLCLWSAAVPTAVPAQGATAAALPAARPAWPDGWPVYDHVVIVVEENKDYDQVLVGCEAPYIKELQRAGANLTKMYAEEHHSQGNYFWLFSGHNQGVKGDTIPSAMLSASNLGQQLIASGRSFAGYSEDLPEAGSTRHNAGRYARKHAPWVSFCNLPPTTNLPFADFPSDFTKLPTVSFVIPNLINDMHGTLPFHRPSVKAGNDWLKKNLDAYYRWAIDHNSLLIVTSDENDHARVLIDELTDPNAPVEKDRNRIFTILVGAHVKHDFTDDTPVTHVNLLRTLEAMYKLNPSGAQQRLAAKAGIADDTILTKLFEPVATESSGAGK